MEAVSSFPWDNVMTTFATQGKTYKELALKLEKDPYYGFEEESSKYGSALVGDLYHISRKLLVEHLGDQNLDKYKCKAHPTNFPLCEALYKEYKVQADLLVTQQAKDMFKKKEEDK